MPRKIEGIDTDKLIQLYLAGSEIKELRKLFGISANTISRLLGHNKRSRSEAMSMRWNRLSSDEREAFVRNRPSGARPRDFDVEEAVRRYQAGEGCEVLEAEYRTKSLTSILKERGLYRSRSAALVARLARLGPEGRQQLTSAAHAAVRGTKIPQERVMRATCTRAKTRERTLQEKGSFEDDLRKMLEHRGLLLKPQKAVGPYNLDLGLDPVAVEVHVCASNPLTCTRIRKRIEYLVNSGWSAIYVWICKRTPLREGAADKVVAFYEEACSHKTPLREYRVIRGTGELVSTTPYAQ